MFRLRWMQPKRLEPGIAVLHTKFFPSQSLPLASYLKLSTHYSVRAMSRLTHDCGCTNLNWQRKRKSDLA